jgi:DNA-binding response OmpR family regulator
VPPPRLSLGRWLRSKMPIGIIYATAAGTALDRIVGLELGADDYIVKPYELREVLARVRSVLRRVPQPTEPQGAKVETAKRRFMSFGSFHADLDGRFVTGADGTVVDMAKSEFDVLEVFLTRANRLLTRTAISEAIGFVEDSESSRAVDIRIMRLRKKIETDPANPKFLRTVRGEGYIFSLPTGESN